jgi:hypothetical protein
MPVAPRTLGASLRAFSPTTIVALALMAAFLIVVLAGAVQAGRRIDDLGHRRDEAMASHSDPADVAGDVAGAFRRFRSALRPGEHFALVFASNVGRDQKGFLQLVSLAVLYPAIAVSDPARADAVMVFGGEPPLPVREAFEPIGVVDGVWVGRRG